MIKRTLVAAVLVFLAATAVQADEYVLDQPHSNVTFTVRHMAISKVRGTFNEFSGNLNLNPADTSKWSCEATIQVASIDTRNEKRDGHLKSGDFFDAENFPTISFTSTKFIPKGDNKFDIEGNLTMRGVTKPVTLQAELTGQVLDPWGNERIGATAKTTVNRMDYGVSWDNVMETGGLVVSHEVDIVLEIEAVKKSEDS